MRSIRGVAGCRAVMDAAGHLAELHVVSTGERPPKLIIRDIQSLLLVRLNLTVPHRKVSVAVVREAAPWRERVAFRESAPSGSGHEMREQAPEYVVTQRPTPFEAASVAPESRQARWEAGELEGWQAGQVEPSGVSGPGPGAEAEGPPGAEAERPSGQPGLVLREVAVRYEGTQLQVRVELTSFGRHLSATVTGPDEGLMPALLGARAVMEALATDPAWRDVHLQWVDVAGVSAAPVAVVSVVRAREGSARGGGPAAVECVGVRPERGNLTLAAAAATVDALVKLLSADAGAL